MKQKIQTDQAPSAIGAYSQGIQIGNTVFFSGQIPLDPATMQLVKGDFKAQVERVFLNLQAVCTAASGSMNDIVKLTIYLTDLANFPMVNEMMQSFFAEPYPARSTVQISALPRAAQVEVEAIMVLRKS